MPDRPIILFPTPERAARNLKRSGFQRISRPEYRRQYDRLHPAFQTLQTAFQQKNLKIQQSPIGMNPDFALVFEIVGTVENFYTAIKHCEGLEWLFDKDSTDIEPDDDFYEIKDGLRSENALGGKLYCIMSNQQAMEQLLSLWRRHRDGEEDVFLRGFAGLRDVFTHIKSIRKWEAQDRIAETHVLEYWRSSLEIDGDIPVPFEIELFFRTDQQKRAVAALTIREAVQELGGRILQECVIEEISYHALLVELPRSSISDLVNQYESIELSQVDDIMFFRPVCQSTFISPAETEIMSPLTQEQPLPIGNPIAAILDGMPIQNHALLRDRIIIDDPDGYEAGYESKYRIHGTAMSSLVIYGDLNRGDAPVSSPIYIRPIMRPKEVGMDEIEEVIPPDKLFVDVLHRAVRRMMDGENGVGPTAPTVSVINFSIGDPVRQLATSMSPLARIIDYLAYKYKLLFIISAGNHPEITGYISSTFADLKARSLNQRSSVFWTAIKDNQRNLKVLSPAESLNALTVGALYDDFSEATETERFIWAENQGLPSPISAIGKGYRGIITPDLLYYGGRKFIKGKIPNGIEWVLSNRAPGCRVAAPYSSGEAGQAYSFGTSDAAAQITHEAIKCYDVLSQIFLDETGLIVPSDYAAILMKAMLTHGASWDSFADELSRITGDRKKELSRWAGNGVPDIDRVQECTQERVTLIGRGALKKDQGDVFRLPLHIDFSTRLVKRKLTVTLAYLSPVVPDKQAYRAAQLWFEIDDGGKGLIPDASRQNNEWQAVRKGTLQHETFIGERPIAWNNDDLIIKVSCREDAGKLRSDAIPYCIFVSFEVAEGLDIDLYTSVATQIHQRVQVANT